MFEDNKLPQPTPAPIEDMFANSSDKPPSAEPKAMSLPPVTPSPELPQVEAGDLGPRVAKFGLIKVAFIVAVVLALIAVAGYASWQIMSQSPADNGVVQSIPGTDSEAAQEEDGVTGDKENDTVQVTEPDEKADDSSFFDTDGDGLTNAEELEAGTLPNRADTDKDGLGDREEVEVYDTDPLEEDTDGDSFLDGQEVKGGYNPNGEGRLFEVPST